MLLVELIKVPILRLGIAEYDDIYVIDSLATTQMLRLLVLKAVALRDQNMDVKDIVKTLEEYKHRYSYLCFC